ncbi:MAG: CHAT domain-containing protein, partial [Chloroflexi bacterium]|nr:CHAT domain-containing protein [Chloroflexota bacterium]
MHEIRLIIDRKGKGYTARWTDSAGQESKRFALKLPITPGDAAELRWYLEEYYQFPGAGDHVRARGVEIKLTDWGRALYDALFRTAEGVQVYNNLMAAPEPRLLTIGAVDPDVLVQPWEMMRDPRGPLAFQGVTVRRQLQGARRPRRDLTMALPVRVLLIVSRPSDVGFIDPRNSIPPILDALDALPGQAEVDFCDPPTLARLEEMVSQARKDGRPYHIVHFDGHGTYLPKTGVGALCFEREDAATHLVTGTQLGDLLARLDVPLVLLEACRSADLSDRPVFGSVAPALLESGVGSVVAFSHAVHIEAARILVERFYRELVSGLTVGQTLAEARAALRANPARWLHLGPGADTIDLQDWFIPQLYQIGPDPALVTPSDVAPSDVGPPPRRDGGEPEGGRILHAFPPAPMYRFHGRALELLLLERAFRQHPAVVVTGMGGMGKTALAREAAAWWLRTGRFDAAVFCSFEQKAGAERAVQLLGQALEGDEFSARSADDQWQTAVRLFHDHPVLLVWDNFESTLPIYQRDASPSQEGAGGYSPVPQGPERGDSPTAFTPEARARLLQLYRDLTAGSPRGRLLVTCRPEATGLPGVKEFPLAGLARPDTLHLLAAILDLKGIDTGRQGYERAEIHKLLDALADNPRSVELVAPHLRTLTPAEIRADYRPLLARFADETAYEGRNRSLLASLEFSKRHLSADARAALPYLAWFSGGAFERTILKVANLEPATWEPIRAELTDTAL